MKLALLLLLAATSGARMEEAQPQRGRLLAPVTWFDELGTRHSLGSFAGNALVLLPMYSHCRATCPINIENLKSALSRADIDAKNFRVVLFSIDPDETSASLAELRQRENIPLAWTIARADAANIESLTNSIGFQFGRNGDQYLHPNIALFIDRRFAIADWIYGSDFNAAQMERGLRAASGENLWFGRHVVGLYGIALFIFSAFLIVLVHLLLQRRRAARPGQLSTAPA